MLVRYSTSFADFKAAQRLARSHRRSLQLSYIFFWWTLPIAGVIAAILLGWDAVVRHFSFRPPMGGVLAGTAFIGIYLACLHPFHLRRLYKRMKRGRSPEDPVELELAGNELISRIPGLSEGRFLPAAILDYAEDDHMALIYVAKGQFLMLPKVGIPEADLQQLRDWISQRGQAVKPS